MKIGVVIPSLNEAEALKKLLQSIEAQLTSELELMVAVVDGLSQDNSKQVVEEFSENYSRATN